MARPNDFPDLMRTDDEMLIFGHEAWSESNCSKALTLQKREQVAFDEITDEWGIFWKTPKHQRPELEEMKTWMEKRAEAHGVPTADCFDLSKCANYSAFIAIHGE